MSDNQNKFNVSQEFEIIPHQKGKAYPIGVKEWEFIKNKICEIKIDVNNFHAFGFLLLGASASCLITILATEFKTDSSKYLTWAIFGVTLIGGFLSVYFANDKHKQESAKPTEIINQMELIESRFEIQK
ncbi:MAG: hypothetical protein ACSHXF_11010 [Aquaticitalea sp.]